MAAKKAFPWAVDAEYGYKNRKPRHHHFEAIGWVAIIIVMGLVLVIGASIYGLLGIAHRIAR